MFDYRKEILNGLCKNHFFYLMKIKYQIFLLCFYKKNYWEIHTTVEQEDHIYLDSSHDFQWLIKHKTIRSILQCTKLFNLQQDKVQKLFHECRLPIPQIYGSRCILFLQRKKSLYKKI